MSRNSTKFAGKVNGLASSWDALTQARFVYAINRQTGNPISWAEAYKTAELAVQVGAELAVQVGDESEQSESSEIIHQEETKKNGL